MYQITAYNMSSKFYSDQDLLFQELIEGNRAASPGCLLIVIILIEYLHIKKLILGSILPITNKIYFLVDQIFVDDSKFSTSNKGNKSEL